MPSVRIANKLIAMDEDGCLINFEDWDEETAQELARRLAVGPLSEESLNMLRFIRDYYRKFNFFPIVQAICKRVAQPKNCVSERFPNALVAWRLAGLPHPEEPIVSLLEAGQSPG